MIKKPPMVIIEDVETGTQKILKYPTNQPQKQAKQVSFPDKKKPENLSPEATISAQSFSDKVIQQSANLISANAESLTDPSNAPHVQDKSKVDSKQTNGILKYPDQQRQKQTKTVSFLGPKNPENLSPKTIISAQSFSDKVRQHSANLISANAESLTDPSNAPHVQDKSKKYPMLMTMQQRMLNKAHVQFPVQKHNTTDALKSKPSFEKIEYNKAQKAKDDFDSGRKV